MLGEVEEGWSRWAGSGTVLNLASPKQKEEGTLPAQV